MGKACAINYFEGLLRTLEYFGQEHFLYFRLYSRAAARETARGKQRSRETEVISKIIHMVEEE